jgi:hypothetical protein
LAEPRSTPTDLLEIAAPRLPRALADPHVLTRVGGALAPVPRCGFEVRLSGSPRVDVQQWITVDDDEPQRLRAHLSDLGWRRLDRFLARWGEPSSDLHREVSDLWLELDQPAAGSQSEVPASATLPPLSVFVGFPPEPSTASERLGVAEAVLDLVLERPAWGPWRANVRRCFEACPEGAFVSHIGMMLGRSAPALRINVKRLGPDRLGPYLQGVGWWEALDGTVRQAAWDQAAETMSQLHRLVDRITVGFDVGARVYPRLGFECVAAGQPPAEPRWGTFLDELVAQGMCTVSKRDALLAWPGVTVPSEDDGPWPPELIRAGLVRPQDHFSVFVRQLGHVKVAYEPGRTLEAKAYFGFFHDWLRATRAPEGRPAPQSAADESHSDGRRDGATRDIDKSGLTTAIGDAIEFLLEARNEDGWWRDFSGLAGGRTLGPDREWITTIGASDEWITAYTGEVLAGTPDGDAHRAARDAWSLLTERRQLDGGWGWNRKLPVDADSTAFGLRLAEAIGMEGSERARAAREVLEGHLLPDGGIPVYRAEALPEGSNSGWCRTPHPCVTAGAAALEDERPRDFLRRTQGEDGSWRAYWWEDEEYTTAFASEALDRFDRLGDRRHVGAGIRWAAGRIGPNGAVYSAAHGGDSAFATALCVRILALAEDLSPVREALGRALTWLLEHQRTHGGWSPSARMRNPRPHVSDPYEPEAPFLACLDEAGVCTTATVLNALVAARPRLRDPDVVSVARQV